MRCDVISAVYFSTKRAMDREVGIHWMELETRDKNKEARRQNSCDGGVAVGRFVRLCAKHIHRSSLCDGGGPGGVGVCVAESGGVTARSLEADVAPFGRSGPHRSSLASVRSRCLESVTHFSTSAADISVGFPDSEAGSTEPEVGSWSKSCDSSAICASRSFLRFARGFNRNAHTTTTPSKTCLSFKGGMSARREVEESDGVDWTHDYADIRRARCCVEVLFEDQGEDRE